MITLIAAIAKNRAIGYKNQLLYHLPDDMRRFRLLTTGHTVIMGRHTFESFPNGALPNRRNIVLSRSAQAIEGCEVFPSLEAALQHCADEEAIFIIGGSSVYRSALPYAQQLILTEVDDLPLEADTFFPPFTGWKEIDREHHAKDERHAVSFDFVTYQ